LSHEQRKKDGIVTMTNGKY